MDVSWDVYRLRPIWWIEQGEVYLLTGLSDG